MFLKYVLSQGLGQLAAGNDSRNEPQSNALLRTTLRYSLAPLTKPMGMACCRAGSGDTEFVGAGLVPALVFGHPGGVPLGTGRPYESAV